MQIETAFDRAIKARFQTAFDGFEVINGVTGKCPEDVRNAAVYVADTLDLCWLAAQTLFGNKAKPEHALAIFDRHSNWLDKMPKQAPPTLDEVFPPSVEELLRRKVV